MAPLLLEIDYADRLRSQADALLRRGAALVREGEELKREALEMRIEADRLETPKVTVGRPATVPAPRQRQAGDAGADHDTVFMDRVVAMLTKMNGQTVAMLADHLGTSVLRVRGALRRLEDAGVIYRTGATKGTRYHVPEPEPEPVRTGTATLHVFTKRMPARELEDRTVAYTTEAPVPVGALPERDTDD